MKEQSQLKIFSGINYKSLTANICKYLNIPVGKSETEIFPDSEILVKIQEDVRGRDCFVVASTCDPVNDNLMELLIFIDSLRRASAGQIIAVIPYFGYGRQDRKGDGRVPITAKLVANMITTAGANRVVAVDLHAAQLEGFFDIPVDHLSATPVFLDYFENNRHLIPNLCLVSPDVGNVKVAQGMANLLGGDLAIIDKKRINGTETKVSNLIGDVSGKTVLMFDDMISTAGTMTKAATFVLERGASKVIAAATHPLFVDESLSKLSSEVFDQVVVTDSTLKAEKPSFQIHLKEKLVQLSIAPLLGEAIQRIHSKKSVSEMFKKTAGTKR